MTIRLLLADDQALVRGAMAALLRVEPDLEIVAEVAHGDQVLAVAEQTRPDVCLLDIEMPGMDGIEVTRQLTARLPGTKVLVVTTFGRPGYLSRAMAAGALGFVVKDIPAEELADATRRVHAGEQIVDPALAARSLTEADPLSPRERELLQLCLEGGSVNDLAERLHLSPGTVRNYLSSAISKTGTRSRTEAAFAAQSRGWL